MKTVFTMEIGKYYEVELDDVFNIKHIPVNLSPKPIIDKDSNDALFDFLLLSKNHPDWFTQEEKQELINLGYDLNLDNYVRVICPYLPFEHFIYLPDNWII